MGMALVCAMICLFGCRPDTGGRVAISGKVQMEGKPLPNGTITFRSAGGEMNTAAGATITEGQYRIVAIKGLVPGDYYVSFDANWPTGKRIIVPSPGAGPAREVDEMVNVIPDDYGPAGAQKVTVVANQKNVFDFSIPKRMSKK